MLRSSFRVLLAAAVVLPLACSRSPRQGGPDRQPAAQPEKGESRPDLAPQLLRARLDAAQPPAYATADPLGKDTWTTVRRLYEAKGYQPVGLPVGEARGETAAPPGPLGRGAARVANRAQ